MLKEQFAYLSNDRITQIHAVRWIPEGEIRAVLQIAHGMVEHIERYDAFAAFLANQGILVTGNDHLGHGNSVRSKEDLGYFAEKKGNVVLIKDMHALRKMTQEQYPDIPYFMLGHSMGSFLLRQYLCVYGRGLAGAVIMGTGHHSAAELTAALALTENLAKVKGWRHRSTAVDGIVSGVCRKNLENPRTSKDWLTKEKEIVDAYVSDERCRFVFTLNAYHNMFLGLYRLTVKESLARMPKDLPVFFVSGAMDPVGNNGKGVLQVYAEFKELGMRNVNLRLYPGDRHEILNETDREKVYEDILGWIEGAISGKTE